MNSNLLKENGIKDFEEYESCLGGINNNASKTMNFEVAYVGQASRLTSNDLRLQAGRPQYIPEVHSLSDFGITSSCSGGL